MLKDIILLCHTVRSRSNLQMDSATNARNDVRKRIGKTRQHQPSFRRTNLKRRDVRVGAPKENHQTAIRRLSTTLRLVDKCLKGTSKIIRHPKGQFFQILFGYSISVFCLYLHPWQSYAGLSHVFSCAI